jgi:hypothetical protein
MSKGQGAVHPGQKKRGPKRFDELITCSTNVSLTPICKIAEQLGLNEQSVSWTLTAGLKKLTGMKLAAKSRTSLLIQQCVLERVWGVADNGDWHPPMQAHSAECGGIGVLPFKKSREGGFEEDD